MIFRSTTSLIILIVCFRVLRIHSVKLLQRPTYSCTAILTDEELIPVIENSEIILTGRLRLRHYQKFPVILPPTSGSNNKSHTDSNINKEFPNHDDFAVSVLVTQLHSNVSISPGEEIFVGPMFIPNENRREGPGCLNYFYPNTKYIFFLKRSQMAAQNVYNPLSPAILFTEEKMKHIYKRQCKTCVKPMVQPLQNQQLEQGNVLTAICLATGIPTPTIIWIHDGKSLNMADKSLTIETFQHEVGHVESILEISNLVRIDSGEYSCHAENILGVASEKFLLQVQPRPVVDIEDMTDELVPCAEEHRAYCLNDGQCYTYKNERATLQCRCTEQYFGDRCHFHIDGLLAFAQSREPNLRTMLYDLSTRLTIGGIFFTLFGSALNVVTFYGFWRCQQRSMQKKNFQKKTQFGPRKFKQDPKTTMNVIPSNKNSKNEVQEPFLIGDINYGRDRVATLRNEHAVGFNTFVNTYDENKPEFIRTNLQQTDSTTGLQVPQNSTYPLNLPQSYMHCAGPKGRFQPQALATTREPFGEGASTQNSHIHYPHWNETRSKKQPQDDLFQQSYLDPIYNNYCDPMQPSRRGQSNQFMRNMEPQPQKHTNLMISSASSYIQPVL